jgi:RNA polymerase sigma factor (sigma-70 family)
MKGFARSVPQMLNAVKRAGSGGDVEILAQVPDRHGHVAADRLVQRDELERLLSRLDSRERSVVAAHYGLDGANAGATYEQVGQRLGLSKERVRQIEQGALAKLRAAALSGVAEG